MYYPTADIRFIRTDTHWR